MGASVCDKCGEIAADIDAGFSPGRHKMRHDCGGTWRVAVTVETMPDQFRSSHRAARNWGVYPHNGAERRLVLPDEAEEIIESDPDEYAHIVAD